MSVDSRNRPRHPIGALVLAFLIAGCSNGQEIPPPPVHETSPPPPGQDAALQEAAESPDTGLPAQLPGQPVDLALTQHFLLGTGLSGVADWSPELAFVDVFKTSRAWISGSPEAWSDDRPVVTNEQGWVTSLAPNQVVRTVMLWDPDGRHYPSGRYTVLYDGEGEIQYKFGAAKAVDASSPGGDAVDVDPSKGGVGLFILSTNPQNPLRNIRFVMPGGVTDDAPFRHRLAPPKEAPDSYHAFSDSCEEQVFNPVFLDRLRGYAFIRFMDWQHTNNSPLATWADRPGVPDARWSTPKGVPLEIMIDLANRLDIDAWFCMPHLADDAFVEQFAAMVKERLNPGLRVYVEHSNEVWNAMFEQSQYAERRGLELGLHTDPKLAKLYYHSRRTVEIMRIWERVFGSTDRLVRVMGAQAAGTWASEQLLAYQDAAQHVDALGIAPYFGGYLGAPQEQARVSAMSVDAVFDELRSRALPEVEEWMKGQAAIAAKHGLGLVAYEGGQHLVGVGPPQQSDTINALFDAVNRDRRMKGLYLDYFALWREHVNGPFAHFVNCTAYTKYGRWGALEYLSQPRAAAPKYDALQMLIEDTRAAD